MYRSKMHNSGTTFKKSMLKCHTDRNNPHNCDNPSIHEPLVERALILLKKLNQDRRDAKTIAFCFYGKILEQINSHEATEKTQRKKH